MINLTGVILVYLYAPPDDSGLPLLISQAAIFGIFNLISLITVSGRLGRFYMGSAGSAAKRQKHE